MIARVHNDKGRGQVLSLHANLREALMDSVPKDKDGCRDARTCYWRVDDSTNVGDTVVLWERK